MWLRFAVLLICLVVVIGCSGGAPAPPSESDAASQIIKDFVGTMAETGEVDSESLAEAKGMAEELKATDATKGDAILKGLEELGGLSDSAAIKAKAEEILSQL